MARNLRGQKELIAGHMIPVMMAVNQMADRLAAGGLLGCGHEGFALQRISQSVEDQQRIFSDEKSGVGDSSIQVTGAALLLVGVHVWRELLEFGIPAGHHRVATVYRGKLLDGRAKDPRRGFIDTR